MEIDRPAASQAADRRLGQLHRQGPVNEVRVDFPIATLDRLDQGPQDRGVRIPRFELESIVVASNRDVRWMSREGPSKVEFEFERAGTLRPRHDDRQCAHSCRPRSGSRPEALRAAELDDQAFGRSWTGRIAGRSQRLDLSDQVPVLHRRDAGRRGERGPLRRLGRPFDPQPAKAPELRAGTPLGTRDSSAGWSRAGRSGLRSHRSPRDSGRAGSTLRRRRPGG